jgi:hypothetical protein
MIQGNRSYTDPHYDANCWNTSKTFNNRSYQVSFNCETKCISKYRVRDGIRNCFRDEESKSINNSCPQIQRHRLQCSSSELTCLSAQVLGDSYPICSNSRDEFDRETNTDFLTHLKCEYRTDPGCIYIRNYITKSSESSVNKTDNVTNTLIDDRSEIVIPFRFYCNSFLNTMSNIDELPEFCQKWICANDQYQCLSGQCIPPHWVCDGKFTILLQL